MQGLKAKNRDEAQRKRAMMLKEKIADNGEWKKKAELEWEFVEGKKKKNTVQGSAYEEAQYLQTEMEDQHADTLMNVRWKEITGHILLTVEDVRDMGYGVDDVKKAEKGDEDEENDKKGTSNGGNDSDSDSDNNDDEEKKGEEKGDGKKTTKQTTTTTTTTEEKNKLVLNQKWKRKINITGAKIKMPSLVT